MVLRHKILSQSALDTPPFFGTRQCGGYFICTMDGIQIDERMHAIRANGSAIEGLYVVGDCSGNYSAGSYPNLMGGAAAGRTVTLRPPRRQKRSQGNLSTGFCMIESDGRFVNYGQFL